MEEELSENELEERMYAMLHYVDETQANVITNKKEINVNENAPRSTLRRYWRTSGDQNSIYQKINTPKEPINNNNLTDNSLSKTKDGKNTPTNASTDLSLFQQPVPPNLKKSIEILDDEYLTTVKVVELESSDEDEVIEVALPPKPTITIESSDDDEVCAIPNDSPAKNILSVPTQDKPTGDREVTASPVPSVVSSVSDEFIRSDCIALNISSRHPNNQSFDFSLHGSDLVDQTPSKKKKKKKNKDATSTPISNSAPNSSTVNSLEECFATPKSKPKKKRQRTKSYKVTEKSIPSADVYDSDSNQSINDNNKNNSPFTVTDESFSNTEVYESDSNQSEIVKEDNSNADQKQTAVTKIIDISHSNEIDTQSITETPKSAKKNNTEIIDKTDIVDLTETEDSTINETIVIANVTGFSDLDDYCDENTVPQGDIAKCGSTKIPAILNADLDFDNLKGNVKTCKRRRYSLTTLRAEMEKFYNESWGGEEFNHREIQKNMSRDKSLWVIDPKDRMSSMSKRKITCNYCNRAGHRDDTCRMKPPICFMCGSTGHFEPRCPRKICVNCGSPNHMYSTMCRNCCNWTYIKCAECGQNGHPASHCPDIWRRYHNTVNLESTLEENRQFKKHYQMFCSGCTRRGHLVHTCRVTLPFSGLPINSPYVAVYRPVYSQVRGNQCSQNNSPNQQNKQTCKNRNVSQDGFSPSPTTLARNEQLKRQSKSPITHDTHQIKKRNLGVSTDCESPQGTKSPLNNSQRKISRGKNQPEVANKDLSESNKNTKNPVTESQDIEKVPDFIPITSENRDKRGQIIQDNEISDTSEVFTSARVYITREIVDKLKTQEGEIWLKETAEKNKVILENETNMTFFLSIRGTVGNQEAFQAELREWIKIKHPCKDRLISESESDVAQESIYDPNASSNNIPKNRYNVLRKLSKAFASLKKDLGDPKDMYKELVYLQNQHQQLINKSIVSPKRLSNNRDNINGMLKKLNMVLLGQAGLADGSKHMSELYALQEKVTNFRQKNITDSLRQEIGEHFHCIFDPIPRDDYCDLLGKYYNKRAPVFKKKTHDKSFKVSPKPNQKKTFNSIQNFQRNVNIVRDGLNENDDNQSSYLKRPVLKKTKNKLIFYHRRLLHSPTKDTVLMKKRSELMRKLHLSIASLGKVAHVSSEDFKNMRNVQEQAKLFLASL